MTERNAKPYAKPAAINKDEQLVRMATYASVTVAAILIALKFFAYLETGSISILSSLVDSILDSAASLINLIAVMVALNPADHEHRFGHGKAEALAGLGQAAFIGGSAVFLVVESVNRLITPHPLQETDLGVGVMIISIFLTLGLVIFQKFVLSKRPSLAIAADSLHYKGDLFMNVAVIIALVLTAQYGWLSVDPIFALGISAYVSYTVWQIVSAALDQLMDKELPDDLREEIADCIMSDERVKGTHDMRTRTAGAQQFLQVHVELAPELTLMKAHKISDDIENRLVSQFPLLDVIIHLDPAGYEEVENEFA
jgi:ferrous-iron efflux pump FieF